MPRRLTLLFLLILVFPISFTYAQQTEPEGESPDTAKKRAEWFARERGVEPGKLPSGLRSKALRELEKMRGDEKRRNAAVASGAISPTAAAANPVSSTSWKTIGPSVLLDSNGSKFSGRISALAIDPRNPLVVYAGAADGGVWKTTDGGQSWTPLTDTQPSLSTGSIALDPSAPDTVYVLTSLPSQLLHHLHQPLYYPGHAVVV